MAEEKPSIHDEPKKAPEEDKISESPEQFLDEPEEHPEPPEKVEHSMKVGEKSVDVYTEEGREELVESGEIKAWEEGFSEGETNPERAHCAQCGKLLDQDKSKVIEKERDHTKYLFCSTVCADKGVKHGKKA